MKNTLIFALVLATVGSTASVAQAGGYDTPMLYTARHMGMGGTAISYVSDGSALFHNPAGLGNIQTANVLGNFTLLLGTIESAPAENGESRTSDTTVAPFPLLGGGVRLHDWVTVGLGVYPVASAGAAYEYDHVASMASWVDKTTLLFIEASPAVALSVPESVGIGRLNIGVGYRLTYVSLSREQVRGSARYLDFALSGFNFASFRAGLQYSPIPELEFGFVYRHKTTTELSADDGVALSFDFVDVKTEFTLPTKLGFGVRGNYMGAALAIDVEYGLNSQNDRPSLAGTNEAMGITVTRDNIFRWTNAVTLRVGAEYDIPLGASREENVITPRLGYVFDQKTGNPAYPTAFGTPPAPTHVFTLGVGYDAGPWEANLAYAYRTGSTEVDAQDAAAATDACEFCAFQGDYAVNLHGIYADFSYDFE